MDSWLEVSSCTNAAASAPIDPVIVRRVPALSEAFVAAHSGNSEKSPEGIWEYARRLEGEELEQVKGAVNFNERSEDSRSVVLSTQVLYGDRCYTLRLFITKSQ